MVENKMNINAKIFVAGHKGLVGSAIFSRLRKSGYKNIITKDRSQLDLLDFTAVNNFFKTQKLEYIFLAAAKVGGIKANNSYPADFIYQNLQIQNNIIHCAYLHKVKKLIFLGSSCIYPKDAAQPIKEEYLLSNHLEPTNYAYAIAKISGVKMCEAYNQQYGCNFIALMPTNIYGQNDNFDLETSHVLPALIRKFHEAKLTNKSHVEIWGSGKPKREFLHADDLADACLFIMNSKQAKGLINVGYGKDISILELANLIKEIIGYKGEIICNNDGLDGAARKILDSSKINNLGWRARITLEMGIKMVYDSLLAADMIDAIN